jgi:hypothetical protein
VESKDRGSLILTTTTSGALNYDISASSFIGNRDLFYAFDGNDSTYCNTFFMR